jgi:hypothetical protein
MKKTTNQLLILGISFTLVSCAGPVVAPAGGGHAPASTAKAVPDEKPVPVTKVEAVPAEKIVPPTTNAISAIPVEITPAQAAPAAVPAPVAAVPASPVQPAVMHAADLIPLAFLITLAMVALGREEKPKS